MSDLYTSSSDIKNPCKKFLRWKDGYFAYWDKERKENIAVKSPFTFVALRQLVTISGFDEKNNCGIWSNEVARLTEEKLQVQSDKGGEIACGYYKDIKDECKAAGGKYTQSIYAMMSSGELVNFQLSGAAFGGWLDRDDSAGGIIWKFENFEGKKKGKVEYKQPIFKPMENNEELIAKARVLYNEQIKPYLNAYLAKKQEVINVVFGASKTTFTAEGLELVEQKQKEFADAFQTSDPLKTIHNAANGNISEDIKRKLKKDEIAEEDLPF